MIGHKNGECADIEIENEDFDVLYPRDGILVHTNHFVSPRLPIVLRDHVEYPSSICRHEDLTAPKGKRMGTVFSMVVNLTQGRIYFCKGNPCEQGYEEYGI